MKASVIKIPVAMTRFVTGEITYEYMEVTPEQLVNALKTLYERHKLLTGQAEVDEEI